MTDNFLATPKKNRSSPSRARALIGSPAQSPAIADSPLSMVLKDPDLNRFVGYLSDVRKRITDQPDSLHTLQFSRREIGFLRGRFAANIRAGEEKLHRLCDLLGDQLFASDYDIQSVVIGEVSGSGERFTLTQPISSETLYHETDLALGNRLLQRIRFNEAPTQLVANFVEYQPHITNRWGIHKMISRIKAEEELWNKVADEIFDLDAIVRRDKQLRPLSRYVKDIFGIKIVVGSPEDARKLHRALLKTQFSESRLARFSVPINDSTRRLALVETKDYLTREGKNSGWRALKSVVRWWNKILEIQIQPLGNYFMEREGLTRESHAGFKQRRESIRARVASRVPLYEFYQSLLQWLFMPSSTPAPTLQHVDVQLVD